MKLIVCGGGKVGTNIAGYLARDGNDVTVIDIDPKVTGNISQAMDVRTVVGHASHPDVLEQAGAYEAEMIIAATNLDEINVTTCQVAHTAFKIPKKIARLRAEVYHSPSWQHLFDADHMPIDIVISPEREVAKAIVRRLKVPGALSVNEMSDGMVKVVGVVCRAGTPAVTMPVKDLMASFTELSLNLLCVLRDDQVYFPSGGTQLNIDDEVYFVVSSRDLEQAITLFSRPEEEVRDLVIMGGGHIGDAILQMIDSGQAKFRAKVIEFNYERARYLAEHHAQDIVLHGDALDTEILREAGVGRAGAFVAVTNDDEANIIGALMAKKLGCQAAATLVTKPQYPSLLVSLGIDSIITPSSITVSGIIQHVRRGRLRRIQTLREGFAEVIEGEVVSGDRLAQREVGEVALPDGVRFGLVIRGEKVLVPHLELRLEPGDYVVLFALQAHARALERLFTKRGG